MAFNFLKLARALATASLVSGAGSAWAETSVTNTAGATIRVNPYSVTATYDKSTSAAVQANGVGGFQLDVNKSQYINPLDSIAASAAVAGSATGTYSSSSALGSNLGTNGCTGSFCRNGFSSLLSVSAGNPVLADVYAVTDSTGTFSLDISSKNADTLTALNSISAPSAGNIGVTLNGASSYSVNQQGVAGISAEVLSPTKVLLNTDMAGGGSYGQISLTSKTISNGVQETYNTQGSVAVDGSSAYVKANTTNHIAINAVNAQISGTQSVSRAAVGATAAGSGTFTNTDIIATTFSSSVSDRDSGATIEQQKAVLASGNYIAKDVNKGATSVKITNDPSDSLRSMSYGASDRDSTGFVTRGRLGTVVENAPQVNLASGKVELPAYSTQTLQASGVSWVSAAGATSAGQLSSGNAETWNGAVASGSTGGSGTATVSPSGSYSQKTLPTVNGASTNSRLYAANQATAAAARGSNAVSNVIINSAAGGGGQNALTSGGFGNTVNLQTTFDMTVFGR